MIEHIKSKLLPFRVNDNVLLIIQFQTTRKGTGKIGFILQFVRKYVFDSIAVTIALILCNGQTDVDVQAAVRGGGVVGLRDRLPLDSVCFKYLLNFVIVSDIPEPTVKFCKENHVEVVSTDTIKKPDKFLPASEFLPGSQGLGQKIAAEFKNHPDYKAVIMENHGVVLCGEDLMDAYQRFETLEFCARTVINAKTLGEPTYLTDDQIEQHEKSLPTDYPHFMGVTYPSDERAIRSLIVKMVRRACDQGLMISSYGTVSVRWRGNDFLITPPGVPRWDIEPGNIVQVKNGMVEAGKIPSRSVALHQEIYQSHPEINSIIITQPPHLMGFCTSGVKFNVRTIPESWIFLKDTPIIPFGVQYEDNKKISDTLKSVPAVLLANDSVLITGDGLLQTFDRLEVAEFSAKSLIMAAPIGELKPINDKEVEDLRVAFHVK